MGALQKRQPSGAQLEGLEINMNLKSPREEILFAGVLRNPGKGGGVENRGLDKATGR